MSDKGKARVDFEKLPLNHIHAKEEAKIIVIDLWEAKQAQAMT